MLVTMKEILDRAKKDNYGVTSIMVDRSSLSYEDNNRTDKRDCENVPSS